MLLCITIPRSDRNGGGDVYKENVTSEQHTHTCRKDKETDKAASTGGEDKDPERCLSIWA